MKKKPYQNNKVGVTSTDVEGRVYITTTLPYVNADPHIGFALEVTQADVVARLNRLLGREVFFNTGTDEHGLKIYSKAEEEGVGVQDYVDRFSGRFSELKKTLNLSYDKFIRTTDPAHIKAAQHLWRKCDESGDIYKKKYKGLYCVGCERFIKEEELQDGHCSNHPNKELQELEEENYFFKFSKYEDGLLKYLNSDRVILPEWRKEEAVEFVKSGLEDFSISRLKENMPWGVPVPGDDEHVFYVWFDALTNYISSLGWPEDKDGNFEKFWLKGETLQFAGKDQVRFQSLMWQAMLMSAGIPNTDLVIYHGFVTSQGRKMSKSVGNVVNPLDVSQKYGTDALRYYLMRHLHPFKDSDFTTEKFEESFNAGLANGLGNLVSRIIKMASSYGVKVSVEKDLKKVIESKELEEWREKMDKFRFDEAMDYIWKEISDMEKYIAQSQPFKLIKEDEEKAKEIVAYLVIRLWDIAVMIEPFMPETAEKMRKYILDMEVPKPLFKRLD